MLSPPPRINLATKSVARREVSPNGTPILSKSLVFIKKRNGVAAVSITTLPNNFEARFNGGLGLTLIVRHQT